MSPKTYTPPSGTSNLNGFSNTNPPSVKAGGTSTAKTTATTQPYTSFGYPMPPWFGFWYPNWWSDYVFLAGTGMSAATRTTRAKHKG